MPDHFICQILSPVTSCFWGTWPGNPCEGRSVSDRLTQLRTVCHASPWICGAPFASSTQRQPHQGIGSDVQPRRPKEPNDQCWCLLCESYIRLWDAVSTKTTWTSLSSLMISAHASVYQSPSSFCSQLLKIHALCTCADVVSTRPAHSKMIIDLWSAGHGATRMAWSFIFTSWREAVHRGHGTAQLFNSWRCWRLAMNQKNRRHRAEGMTWKHSTLTQLTSNGFNSLFLHIRNAQWFQAYAIAYNQKITYHVITKDKSKLLFKAY